MRKGAGTNYAQKKKSELTKDGQKHAKNKTMAVLKKGTDVTCKAVKTVNGDTWLYVYLFLQSGKDRKRGYVDADT